MIFAVSTFRLLPEAMRSAYTSMGLTHSPLDGSTSLVQNRSRTSTLPWLSDASLFSSKNSSRRETDEIDRDQLGIKIVGQAGRPHLAAPLRPGRLKDLLEPPSMFAAITPQEDLWPELFGIGRYPRLEEVFFSDQARAP